MLNEFQFRKRENLSVWPETMYHVVERETENSVGYVRSGLYSWTGYTTHSDMINGNMPIVWADTRQDAAIDLLIKARQGVNRHD